MHPIKVPAWLKTWKAKAEALETQVVAIYLAYRHPGTPWYAKVLAFLVAAYALSPIDLIPDFIPLFGYLDDLLILPVGVMLVIKLVPPDVMRECQEHAAEWKASGAPRFRWMGLVIVLIWISILIFVIIKLCAVYSSSIRE